MANWMHTLGSHYAHMRSTYPSDDLLIIFDIDGTIIDNRYMMHYVLHSFDRTHNTTHFQGLTPEAIHWTETRIRPMLTDMGVPDAEHAAIEAYFREHRWSDAATFNSHRPYQGVLEVMRWFQLQPRTHVALNTGRPEPLRELTLNCLNVLGDAYKLDFASELLFMNPDSREEGVEEIKIAGVRHFQQMGFRVVAFVDNEPENLSAVASIDEAREILLLHADTIFETKRTRLPRRSIRGTTYHLHQLAPPRTLPEHIHFVWHGVNTRRAMDAFLAADVAWAECDARLCPDTGEVILSCDCVQPSPATCAGADQHDADTLPLRLGQTLPALLEAGKSVKIDLMENGRLLTGVLETLATVGVDDRRLWFSAPMEVLREDGFRTLANAHPDAVIQCPVDFVMPLVHTAPLKAREILEMLGEWGVNRFAVHWQAPGMKQVLDHLDAWGVEACIESVPDLQSFLHAVLLMPVAITSGFNFPEWDLHGDPAQTKCVHVDYPVRVTHRAVPGQ